jgi:uncharacterized protein (DUF305 family)
MKSKGQTTSAALLAVLLAAGCAGPQPVRAPVIQAGAPGEEGRVVGAAQAGRVTAPRHVAADARFMRDMIVHHLQAVEMTALVAERTDSPDIRLLAERIQASQDDEIRMMQRWLTERGESLPAEHAHHAHHGGQDAHAGMHGMLSPDEMAQLRAARGAEFDRLFLEGMIKHHEGAIVMVEELFAIDGAGQETEIFQFASHVDADQRMEIMRMQRMLAQRRQ